MILPDLLSVTERRYQRLERASLPDSAHLSITRNQIKEYIVANIDELMKFADIDLDTQELGESVDGSIHCRVVARVAFDDIPVKEGVVRDA